MDRNDTPVEAGAQRDRDDLTLPDVQGEGQHRSIGIPAAGSIDGMEDTTGEPGIHHWRESTISEPGLTHRGNVFFAAVEMTRMPMILTDPNLPDNPIVFANRAFQDLTGYAEAEIVGRNCRFLQGANTSRETIDELRMAVQARRAISVEILNYKRDGTPFWNACFIGPVFDRGGKLLYFFASQLDVTRRRASEQAFRQAQKMEAIGQLTAGLAHDFNNLLQVISGNLDLLALHQVDDRTARLLRNAQRAADHGAKLTRQLLAFARKTRLEPRPTDLNSLVLEFGNLLGSTVGSTVEVQVNLRPRLPLCMVDPVHLEMALLNVVINARDAMPKGGTVTITTQPVHLNGEAGSHHLPPGDYVALSVTDQGSGMPPHVVERATEPFFTTKETGKGTGLGLAMVHGFVQQSLGRLEIDSALGRGTTIRMLFPTADAAAERPLPTWPHLEDGSAPPADARVILVVEDNEDILELAREYLEGHGYVVIGASDADAAMAILADETRAIDLMFTDLIMPGSMNGIALAEEVRRMRPFLPVLFTTGYNEDLVADGELAAGMDLVGKPYRRAELLDRVRGALNRPAHTTPDGRSPHKEG
jgi:PAS domain S-box-containing protein